jgi:hypothetical protein
VIANPASHALVRSGTLIQDEAIFISKMLKRGHCIMNTIANRLNKHFAVAAAAVAVVGATQAANATVVYSGVVSIAIPVTTAGVYLNVVTGVNSANPGSAPGWDINPWSANGLSFFNPSNPTGGVYVVTGGAVNNLAVGTMIDAASTYGSGAAAASFNLNSSNNLVGFRFLNEGTSAVNYGWVRIQLGASLTDASRAIVGYAYDDSGAGISAGVVPAPGSLALIGLAGGIAARRRRA